MVVQYKIYEIDSEHGLKPRESRYLVAEALASAVGDLNQRT